MPLPYLAVRLTPLLRTGWACRVMPLQSDAFDLPCSMAHSSAQDRLGLQSDAFAIPCSTAHSSAQGRFGLSIFPSSPAMLVEMSVLFSV